MTIFLPLLPPLPAPRREVSVLFVDVVGSTRLAQQLSLELYGALMAETLRVLILCCTSYGGEVLQHQGDAVVAIWSASEAASALQAAVQTHVRAAGVGLAARLGLRLALHAGVASGTVVLGSVGGSLTAHGLPINFARRLCDAAGGGDTLVCGETLALTPGCATEVAPGLTLRDFPIHDGVGRLVALPDILHMKSS